MRTKPGIGLATLDKGQTAEGSWLGAWSRLRNSEARGKRLRAQLRLGVGTTGTRASGLTMPSISRVSRPGSGSGPPGPDLPKGRSPSRPSGAESGRQRPACVEGSGLTRAGQQTPVSRRRVTRKPSDSEA